MVAVGDCVRVGMRRSNRVLMRQAVKDGGAISLGPISTSGLKGSLRENNEGCFLVAEAITAQAAAIRAITTSPRHAALFWEECAREKQDISLCFG